MKHKIIISVLCGPERERWINPRLFDSLIALQWDSRFSILISNTYGFNRYEVARNRALQMARDNNPDALVQIDNDMVLPTQFGDVLSDAIASEKDVVGFPSARALLHGGHVTPESRIFARCVEALSPPERQGNCGEFVRARHVGTGVLIIRAEVWRRIPRGPWFKWLAADDELLSPRVAEDYYFCELAEKHGLSVWSHRSVAGHLKTIDITNVVSEAVR